MLSRHATAAILSAMGFRITPATLATKASRGGGPPYQLFGRTTIYRWGSALAWAESLLTPPRSQATAAAATQTRCLFEGEDSPSVAADQAQPKSQRKG
jgi:hypothetical protein